MKKTLKTLKKIGVALTLATMFTTAGKAAIYNLDPGNTRNQQPGRRSLSYPGGILSNFSWDYDEFANPDTLSTGNITVFGNVNMMLRGPGVGGSSAGVGDAPITHWYDLGIGPNAENHGNVQPGVIQPTGSSIGNWFAMPKLTTIIAGALLLLPFGASTMRFVHKKRTA